SGNRPNDRRLACAVRPEQRQQFSLPELERRAIERHRVAKGFLRAGDGEDVHASTLRLAARGGSAFPGNGGGGPVKGGRRTPMGAPSGAPLVLDVLVGGFRQDLPAPLLFELRALILLTSLVFLFERELAKTLQTFGSQPAVVDCRS